MSPAAHGTPPRAHTAPHGGPTSVRRADSQLRLSRRAAAVGRGTRAPAARALVTWGERRGQTGRAQDPRQGAPAGGGAAPACAGRSLRQEAGSLPPGSHSQLRGGTGTQSAGHRAMGRRQQERQAPPGRGRGHRGCQAPPRGRHFRPSSVLPHCSPQVTHTCCLYANIRGFSEPDLHPVSLRANRECLGTVSWHSRAWKELLGGTEVALTLARG